MKLAQLEDDDGLWIGAHDRGRWLNYSRAEALYLLLKRGIAVEPVRTLQQLIETGEFDVEEIREILGWVRQAGLLRQVAAGKGAVLKAPILRPPKIIALGLNYVLHAREGSFDVPKEPIIFAKAGSSVIGPGEVIRLPRGMGRMDHEVELALVIGRRACGVRKREAFRYVAGYTIANDVTARDLQTRDINNRHPWFRSKSFDTFTPLGPWMVTADAIPPPVRLALECRVNGKPRQKANTRDLVFDIPTVIESVSKHITLDPADVICTGTPAGIGPLKAGDTVVCRIEKIGELRNTVRHR